MPKAITSAAVLGAGTMGAQIAAHLANAGVPVLLLDVSEKAAADGLRRARATKPDPFFTPDVAALIGTGSFDDLSGLRDVSWVIEAVVERLDAKRALLARVEAHAGADAIVSSNTSAIPLSAIAEGRSAAFRRRWLGTHFFNPPRYLPLLEVIATADTGMDVRHAVARFADYRLGKGVVFARDTPGFIANRIGLYGLMQVFRAMAADGYTVEEVDAITGPAIGRPKSATFRTLDLAGLDIFAAVTRDLAERLPDGERGAFQVPEVVARLLDRGLTGAKSGAGFYRKREDGAIEALDAASGTYRTSERPKFASIEAARAVQDTAERIRALFRANDRAGAFLRATLAPTILYAARVAPQVAERPTDVDRAMRLGFDWELGPLETLRALGTDALVAALPPDTRDEAAALFADTLAALDADRESEEVHGRSSAAPDPNVLRTAKNAGRTLARNPGASLVDLGDGVLCVEFHSKMNAIGGDTIEMLHRGVSEAASGFAALVVGNGGQHFSAGANLMLLLLEAQEENWDEVDLMVRSFQGATMALKHAPVPVVVATAGLTLGGGCEIALHGTCVQAAAESYIGLVEAGVGLIPAGGGTKEMLARAMEGLAPGADPLPFVQRVFETIGFARVSTSGPDARRAGYLREGDGITMNRERLIADAKAVALARSAGYRPVQPRTNIPVGGANVLAALKLGVHLAWRAGRISDHDATIGRKLAWVLAGGSDPAARSVPEQVLLDLEREAFLSLCGEQKTRDRIAHTLKTGKSLRN